MDLEHSRKVQSGIFLNQGVYFDYTQLLPGVEMFQLILGARGAPLRGRSRGAPFNLPIREWVVKVCAAEHKFRILLPDGSTFLVT